MRPLLLLLSTAMACQAYDMRFRNLRSNRDGSILYFIADARLAGTDQPFHGKIFAFSEKGIETVVSLPRIVNDAPDPPASNVWSMDASLDGEVFAYMLTPLCDQIQPCNVTSPGRSAIARRNGQVLWEGTGTGLVRLSADGRHALISQYSAMFRLDLSSLTRKLILSGSGIGTIAPGGLVLLNFGRPEYHLFREGEWETHSARSGAMLSPDGSTIVYSPQNSAGWVAKNLRTGTGIPVDGEPIMVSENGTRILTRLTDPVTFRSAYRVFDTSSSQSFAIPGITSGGPEIILSPNGKIVFYTQGPTIYKVDIERATAEPILFRPMRLQSIGESAVPGSLLTINAADVFPQVSASATPPIPTALAGFRATVDGVAAPILSLDTTLDFGKIQIQIPWEIQSSNPTVSVRLFPPQRSPFEGLSAGATEPDAVDVNLASRVPRFLYADAGTFVQAVHQDLDRPITTTDPARPGEVIHFFLTGLGPLNRAVPTGVAAPSEPPARPVQPLNCLGLPVLDTVLAPGMVGVYRATVAVPSFATNTLTLTCEGRGGIIPVARP